MTADELPLVHPDGTEFTSSAGDRILSPAVSERKAGDQQQMSASVSDRVLPVVRPQKTSSPPREEGASQDATRQLQEDLNAARKAVKDLREVINLRDKTIAQKDEALALAKAKHSKMQPPSIQLTRTDFDHIQVANL
jgi:hypothetical protein